jgi:hypothetical protein
MSKWDSDPTGSVISRPLGTGSVIQDYGSEDPDSKETFTDPHSPTIPNFCFFPFQGHIPRLENCFPASSHQITSRRKRSSGSDTNSDDSSDNSSSDNSSDTTNSDHSSDTDSINYNSAAPFLCSQLSLDCLNCTCDYSCQYGKIR